MVILQTPAPALLYLAALLLSALGGFWKKGFALSYLGGFCWAAGTVAALLEGAELGELLAVALLLLTVTALSERGARPK